MRLETDLTLTADGVPHLLKRIQKEICLQKKVISGEIKPTVSRTFCLFPLQDDDNEEIWDSESVSAAYAPQLKQYSEHVDQVMLSLVKSSPDLKSILEWVDSRMEAVSLDSNHELGPVELSAVPLRKGAF